MNRLVSILVFLFAIIDCFAQETAKVSASYTYYAPETKSIEEAKRIALDRAKIQAIADQFGTVVSQSTYTIVSNKNGLSDTQFFSLGGCDVKGEWIETIGNPIFEIQFEEHFVVVKCIISGLIREILQPQTDFVVKVLRNDTNLKYESSQFKDGDDMFLYIKSPVNGFLMVYLVDEKNQISYQIFPYRGLETNAFELTANEEYILFSKKESNAYLRRFVDEYTLTAEDELELNDLYVILSASQIDNPFFSNSSYSNSLKSLTLRKFQTWLSKLKKERTDIVLKKILLTISKQ